MNYRRIAATAILSFAKFSWPFNIDIRESPTNRLVRSRIHLFGPDVQNQQHNGKRNDTQRLSTSGSPSHSITGEEIDFIGGGFGFLGERSPPFPYAIEMMPQTANGREDDRLPDGLIIRHLEDEDITSILPEIVREFGSLAPPLTTMPEPGDDLSSKVENFLFSLTVLIGLTQRVKRRKEGYSDAITARPDHNVICLVEQIPIGTDDDYDYNDRKVSYSGKIVGIAELSWQPPDPNSNAPPFVLPYYAKALISRFFVRNNGGDDATAATAAGGGGAAVPRGYVSNVLVWKTRRGRGYGRVLMAACEGIAKMWGCDDVSLHVDANENSGRVARALYRSLGYEGVPDRGASRSGMAGYGWMGPSMANQGLYLVDGVPLLYLRKRLKAE
jgi:GNAT superfamily N-acetyltransferase